MLVWYYAPRWLMLLAVLLLYLIPLFPLSGTSLVFGVMVALAFVLPTSGIGAVVLAVVFYLILGSKELVFLGRNRVYESIVLLLIFLGALEFFRNLFHATSAFSFGQLVIGGMGSYLLLQALFRREAAQSSATLLHPRFAAALATLLLVEAAAIIALLPMNVFYKTAFLLLVAAVLVDVLLQYLSAMRDARGIFVPFAFFFILAVFMLVSNSWQP